MYFPNGNLAKKDLNIRRLCRFMKLKKRNPAAANVKEYFSSAKSDVFKMQVYTQESHTSNTARQSLNESSDTTSYNQGWDM